MTHLDRLRKNAYSPQYIDNYHRFRYRFANSWSSAGTEYHLTIEYIFFEDVGW